MENVGQPATGEREYLLSAVTPLAGEILATLRLHPEISQVAIAGDCRRAMETVRQLDFVAATREPALVCEDFLTLPQGASVIACDATTASVRLHSGIRCNLRAVTNAQFPFALRHLTGSNNHNAALGALARQQGLTLDDCGFGLTDEPMRRVGLPADVHDERAIYQALGLGYIEPELRENLGELAAAAARQLPRLIELGQLRGTFHTHTTASDGIHSLEELAEEAMDLGLQYLGIADHSKSSVAANGLDEARLLEQLGAIRRLNAGFTHFRLFAGTEVDILTDGTLDFDDATLAQLDYCVASVHHDLDLPEAQMTRRICRAMENGHVTMLGHLTGRLLLERAGYAVDHGRVIDCAAATHTVIELNCGPRRLDMDWRWWRRARDKGVLCAINPDAHSTAGLHHLGLGIRLARKGWLRRQDVINTRSAADVEAFFATPKAQR
jgi:DNA polymerase (family 10)